MKLRERWQSVAGDESARPLVVLFGLNFVDELDQLLFGIVTPEIRDTFELSDQAIILISIIVAVFVLFSVLPITYLADRLDRTKLVVIAALGWVSMSVLSGVAGWTGLVVLLVVARMGSGLGRTVNDPVHASLLTDYYSPKAQPTVFALHRSANPISRVTAVLLGAGASVLPWQAMFVLVAIPTLVFIGGAIQLGEPRQKSTMTAAGIAEPKRFGEARRYLFGLQSMRRLYLAAFFFGAGLLAWLSLISLFFEDVYDYTPFERGVVTALAGLGTVVGLVVGRKFAHRATEDDRPDRLATIMGISFVVSGAGLVAMAVAPYAVLSVIFVVIGAAGLSAYQPAWYPLVGLLSPNDIRTQAFGWSLIILGVGGILGGVLVSSFADQSYRIAAGVLSVLIALAGLAAMSAAAYVAADVEAKDSSTAQGSLIT